MAEAIFRKGNYRTMDYVATADIDAGDVVLIGNTAGLTCAIAHHAIANTATGSLATGGGTYEVIAAANYTQGAKVYWDNSAKKVITTSTNNAQFGYLEEASVANTACLAKHDPHA